MSGIVQYLFNECVHKGCRFINSSPGDGSVTFRYRTNPNQLVDPRLASLIEDAAWETGLDINLSATTNGAHSPTSNHYDGYAADVNRINGLPVSDIQNWGNVQALQEAFRNNPTIRENFGPYIFEKNTGYGWKGYVGSERFPLDLRLDHYDHIHISVQR